MPLTTTLGMKTAQLFLKPRIPRSRGLSEHRVFSCEECGFPAHVPGWRDHWEAHLCLQCQAQRVPRDTAGRCEPVDCNMTVFRRTLLSILHSVVLENSNVEKLASNQYLLVQSRSK